MNWKFRSQRSEFAQWKNDEKKIDEESLQLHDLVKMQQKTSESN